jgi:anti-sigma regulatory factor (Ser/Thr protein kinase)
VAESIRIAVEDASQTAEARRVARKMAKWIGFDEIRTEQISIVVTEACTNLLKHAGQGEILLRTTGEDQKSVPALEVMALDRGPGMNLDRCLEDGFSTSESRGEGLGAVMRLSPASDFYSVPSKGTVVLARWPSCTSGAATAKSAMLKIGAVNVSKRGQEVCGDSWGMVEVDGQSVFLVADGLGHGYEAHVASSEAVRMLYLHPTLTPKDLIERTHQALRSTRGAAVAVARIHRGRGEISFCGVGNISGHIYSSSRPCQHLVSVNGTAGLQSQTIHEFNYEWLEDSVLVLHSDGLSSATALDSYPRLPARDASLIAGVLYRDFSRGHDDSTVVVAKAA